MHTLCTGKSLVTDFNKQIDLVVVERFSGIQPSESK